MEDDDAFGGEYDDVRTFHHPSPLWNRCLRRRRKRRSFRKRTHLKTQQEKNEKRKHVESKIATHETNKNDVETPPIGSHPMVYSPPRQEEKEKKKKKKRKRRNPVPTGSGLLLPYYCYYHGVTHWPYPSLLKLATSSSSNFSGGEDTRIIIIIVHIRQWCWCCRHGSWCLYFLLALLLSLNFRRYLNLLEVKTRQHHHSSRTVSSVSPSPHVPTSTLLPSYTYSQVVCSSSPTLDLHWSTCVRARV